MSPRPKRYRKIRKPPVLRGYKPLGMPVINGEYISVLYEEFEALRLADYENLSQENASEKMNISRPTFTRIYDNVRKKIAKAFIEGKMLMFEGGNVKFDKEWYRCSDCHFLFYIKAGEEIICKNCNSQNIEHINESIRNWHLRNRCKNRNKSQSKTCICSECGLKITGKQGVPCRKIKCPECQIPLTKEN
ncbi:MAG: DUF134 domain-containing protein [Bacteroidales bacterium]|nr:DUF134 domain-containing protein [Bacteroidales bacterium]